MFPRQRRLVRRCVCKREFEQRATLRESARVDKDQEMLLTSKKQLEGTYDNGIKGCGIVIRVGVCGFNVHESLSNYL